MRKRPGLPVLACRARCRGARRRCGDPPSTRAAEGFTWVGRGRYPPKPPVARSSRLPMSDRVGPDRVTPDQAGSVLVGPPPQSRGKGLALVGVLDRRFRLRARTDRLWSDPAFSSRVAATSHLPSSSLTEPRRRPRRMHHRSFPEPTWQTCPQRRAPRTEPPL